MALWVKCERCKKMVLEPHVCDSKIINNVKSHDVNNNVENGDKRRELTNKNREKR